MATIDEMMFRAVDDEDFTDVPMASGDSCPNCEAILAYEEGERTTRESPGEPPTVYCPDCGLEFEIDWERQSAILAK